MSDENPQPQNSPLRWSETRSSIVAALVKAQAQFPRIPKDNTADTGQYKYDYADLAALLDAVRPILAANGLCVLQPVGTRGGDAWAVTHLAHESGEWCESICVMPSSDRVCQKMGSAMTYARRYGLQGMLGLAPESDDDGAAASEKKPAPAPAPAPTYRPQAPRQQELPRARPAPAKSPPAVSTSGRIVCPIGPNKGVPIDELSDQHLANELKYHQAQLPKSAGKPWHAKNEAYVEALQKVVDGRVVHGQGPGVEDGAMEQSYESAAADDVLPF